MTERIGRHVDAQTAHQSLSLVREPRPTSFWIQEVFSCHEASREIPPLIKDWAVRTMQAYYEDVPNERVAEMIGEKVYHTRDVVESSQEIVEGTSEIVWNRPQAASIASLHDIGRFPQAFFHTFSDTKSGYDHAMKGAEMVSTARLPFGEADCDEEVILGGIEQHSRAEVTKQDPYAFLIRDADKLALLRRAIATGQYVKNISFDDLRVISKQAREAFLGGRLVLHKEVDGRADVILRTLSWIADYNFQATRNAVVTERLLPQLLDQLEEVTQFPVDSAIVDKVKVWEAMVKAL